VQSIDEFVSGRLAAWEVAGCAVAAVRDGEVVLAAGWGHRDQAAGTPVTKDTLFAIGSVTKAFTAAARDPEVLSRLSGTYAMGPVEIVVAVQGDRVLTVAAPGSPPLELEPGHGLRFCVKGQPAITVEFELDDTGAVTRLVASR
jgi:Beta-lactamase